MSMLPTTLQVQVVGLKQRKYRRATKSTICKIFCYRTEGVPTFFKCNYIDKYGGNNNQNCVIGNTLWGLSIDGLFLPRKVILHSRDNRVWIQFSPRRDTQRV